MERMKKHLKCNCAEDDSCLFCICLYWIVVLSNYVMIRIRWGRKEFFLSNIAKSLNWKENCIELMFQALRNPQGFDVSMANFYMASHRFKMGSFHWKLNAFHDLFQKKFISQIENFNLLLVSSYFPFAKFWPSKSSWEFQALICGEMGTEIRWDKKWKSFRHMSHEKRKIGKSFHSEKIDFSIWNEICNEIFVAERACLMTSAECLNNFKLPSLKL